VRRRQRYWLGSLSQPNCGWSYRRPLTACLACCAPTLRKSCSSRLVFFGNKYAQAFLIIIDSNFAHSVLIGIFLISSFGLEVRGIATPNIMVGCLLFFGGVCQFIAGIMEFVSGNTVNDLTNQNPSAISLTIRSLAPPSSRPTVLSTWHTL
jgi:GPR1/FUN34/yaaH family